MTECLGSIRYDTVSSFRHNYVYMYVISTRFKTRIIQVSTDDPIEGSNMFCYALTFAGFGGSC